MSYEEERSSGSKTIWVVLGILGGVFLVGVLVCGGLVYVAFQAAKPIIQQAKEAIEDTPISTQLAQKFLNDLRSDRLDEAYARTSAAFKSRTSQKEFEDLVHRYPAIRKSKTVDDQGFNVNMKPDFQTRIYTHSFVGETGKNVQVDVTVVKELDKSGKTSMAVGDVTFRESTSADGGKRPATKKGKKKTPEEPEPDEP